jgi:ABC-type phosphate transport system substrate-binding protein
MKTLTAICITTLLFILTGCDRQPSSQDSSVSLTGAGATFPQPLYDKWAAQYSSMHSNVRIN